jgi:TrmH family RNA methyltransferase
VLGNEGKGIRAEMRKILHNTISIPIEPKLESLNVAVAGGIIMFEINKRGEADF